MITSTIADIIKQGLPAYQQQYGALNADACKAVAAIVKCRTPLMGGHRYECERCGHELRLFNSCRNRHCPTCQTTARLQWVSDRIDDLLPVGYFHAVFTIPQELNPFALRNRAALYSMLFRAVKETLLELASDPKRLGAQIGIIMVLHTWGQNVLDHPHIHCIIPGGGLDSDTDRWKAGPCGFLFPIAIMQKLYRGIFMDYFVKAVSTGGIVLHGQLQEYKDAGRLQKLKNILYNKRWVVYIKPPFASPQAVIKYLGQYTHRVAISNKRIINVESGMVTFSYKDYADGNKQKAMRVTAVEFVRRFLLHIVPTGFVRIRHYGILANCNRKTKLARCRKIFHKKPPTNRKNQRAGRLWSDIVKELTGRDLNRCPCCGGRLSLVAVLPRVLVVNVQDMSHVIARAAVS